MESQTVVRGSAAGIQGGLTGDNKQIPTSTKNLVPAGASEHSTERGVSALGTGKELTGENTSPPTIGGYLGLHKNAINV
ncbi:hypothetical protein U9M48_023338 [Paspalum notatum var. saurae]|uniref:Uncharacterized protein n=1 Tax=Paspalum notatum var. saurae TaxID=547442 RepID=A0AAQ3WVV9_PASNO